ncbi:hypothetical protein IFM89_001156 [Coptis chinensis]|uniref:Uncharacterized protein n=1 Tax=Coptis chinensis TaxID=261450 RepID=A0A835IMR2_9MAGN|nr:hypothetical protein IFM89_001156 [Coptis chinensis]
MCVRLFKEGWFETDVGEGFDLKLSRMKKEVVIGPEDVKEVDNDFFLVVVKIVDHQAECYIDLHKAGAVYLLVRILTNFKVSYVIFFFDDGPLSITFPVENRTVPVTMRALKTHLDKAKNLPFVKKISDFYLLLLLSRFLDPNADIPALAECVQTGTSVPKGYQLLIDSVANAS